MALSNVITEGRLFKKMISKYQEQPRLVIFVGIIKTN